MPKIVLTKLGDKSAVLGTLALAQTLAPLSLSPTLFKNRKENQLWIVCIDYPVPCIFRNCHNIIFFTLNTFLSTHILPLPLRNK